MSTITHFAVIDGDSTRVRVYVSGAPPAVGGFVLVSGTSTPYDGFTFVVLARDDAAPAFDVYAYPNTAMNIASAAAGVWSASAACAPAECAPPAACPPAACAPPTCFCLCAPTVYCLGGCGNNTCRDEEDEDCGAAEDADDADGSLVAHVQQAICAEQSAGDLCERLLAYQQLWQYVCASPALLETMTALRDLRRCLVHGHAAAPPAAVDVSLGALEDALYPVYPLRSSPTPVETWLADPYRLLHAAVVGAAYSALLRDQMRKERAFQLQRVDQLRDAAAFAAAGGVVRGGPAATDDAAATVAADAAAADDARYEAALCAYTQLQHWVQHTQLLLADEDQHRGTSQQQLSQYVLQLAATGGGHDASAGTPHLHLAVRMAQRQAVDAFRVQLLAAAAADDDGAVCAVRRRAQLLVALYSNVPCQASGNY